MTGVDCFKAINDTFGHLMADSVLCAVAERLNLLTRTHEYIGRYDGAKNFWLLLFHHMIETILCLQGNQP